LSAAGVTAWARMRMSNYKVPRYVEICAALPVSDVGKVVKEALRRNWRERTA
jgi:acyl-CoA synthetase (AMP-forming)/AMP-acid ligase II